LHRHGRDGQVRGRLGVQFDLDHGAVRLVRYAGCALLPRQYLQQWLLLQRQLPGRRLYLRQHGLELHLRLVQVRALHLRQRQRALLPDQHLPDQHRLRDL
jgi:hypothetical protein